VHPRVGPPRHHQPQLPRWQPQHLLEPGAEHPGHGPPPWLRRPADEVGAVIAQVEPQPYVVEPATPIGGDGLGPVLRQSAQASSLALPASTNPAASAASPVRNHTSATVWSYQGDAGLWYFIESWLPLT
jgi:hypothetical protein